MEPSTLATHRFAPRRSVPRWLLASLPVGLACLLVWATMQGSAARLNCTVVLDRGGEWLIDVCSIDPEVERPMAIVVDGTPQGEGALVRIYHRSQRGSGTPQVAIIYASGFVRLKQSANPAPPIPFGSSFVLGPAYWTGPSTYHHNPQLGRLEIDSAWLPQGPLRVRASGSNKAFDVAYDLVLPPTRDRQMRLRVTQSYTATADVGIDPKRRAESQGFKLVQFSSMFISAGSICEGGHSDCHDSDAVRYIGSDLARHQVNLGSPAPNGLVFSATRPLGSTWLDLLHTDDESWQGNTPNLRVALDALPTDRTITPQGWISATADPQQDNVGLWLHDDGPASQAWQVGQSDQVSYWLLAQDDPPAPWTDLGLRPGYTFLDFEGAYNCFPVLPELAVTGTVAAIAGYTDRALELRYDIGSDNGNWAQVRCNFDPPLDLSAYDHLRFDWRGDMGGGNSLEVGLINPGAGKEHIFARYYRHATHHAWWSQLVIPFDFLHPWTDGATFDPSQVSAFFVSVVKDPVTDVGGAGRIAIEDVSANTVISRTVPTSFTTVANHVTASVAAAHWLATQQQGTGLLKSWEAEMRCVAHTYDQALALLVFASEGMWPAADAVADALVTTQNADGSWFKSYKCDDRAVPCEHCYQWEGDMAWAVYALSRYSALGGAHPQARTAAERGAAWLVTRLSSDGCFVRDHTEGSIDLWWALQAAGPAYVDEAQGLADCLLAYYWDEGMGRFKGGKEWYQPYQDNQTWGAAFLKAIGEEQKARRALSYAREVLRLPAQGGQLFGFDGQAGPWSVWNEGTAQYIAVGGDGADDLLLELLAQQRTDGAVPGSPDDFLGSGVWTTRWHGVAPTAWLYNALNAEPFHATRYYSIYYPIVFKLHTP